MVIDITSMKLSTIGMAKRDQSIQWWQISNVIPIITSTVMIVLAFASLKTDVEVIKNTNTRILAEIEDQKQMWLKLESRVGHMELVVVKLEER